MENNTPKDIFIFHNNHWELIEQWEYDGPVSVFLPSNYIFFRYRFIFVRDDLRDSSPGFSHFTAAWAEDGGKSINKIDCQADQIWAILCVIISPPTIPQEAAVYCAALLSLFYLIFVSLSAVELTLTVCLLWSMTTSHLAGISSILKCFLCPFSHQLCSWPF